MHSCLLRKKMAERKITQKELARLVGMSVNSLSRKLRGERIFTVPEAAAVSSALGIDETQFLVYFGGSERACQ